MFSNSVRKGIVPVQLLVSLGTVAFLPGCGDAQPSDEASFDSVEQSVIYGDDNRADVYAATDKNLVAIAKRTTVALVSRNSVSIDASGKVQVLGPKLSDPNGIGLRNDFGTEVGRGQLCPTQDFADDRAGASCSGTLIGEDLVLTAGHCIDVIACGRAQFVFGYYRDSETALHGISAQDVFDCQSVVVRGAQATSIGIENSNGATPETTTGGINTTVAGDFAIVRLNRKAPNFATARVQSNPQDIAVGTKVAMAGYPQGIPAKIADNGKVTASKSVLFADEANWDSNLDSFPSNSGSGVYTVSDYTLKGIMVMGNPDNFVLDSSQGCYNWNQVGEVADPLSPPEVSTYAWRAMQALCGYEPNNPVCAPANQLKFTSSDTSSATKNTRNQWIYLNSGQKLVVGHCASGGNFVGDPFLRLHDNQGLEVASNDDKSDNTCSTGSEIQFTASKAGLYELREGCWNTGTCSGSASWTIQDLPVYLEAECTGTSSGAFRTTVITDAGYSAAGHLTSVANSTADTVTAASADRATYDFRVALAGQHNLFFRVDPDGNGAKDSWFYRVDSGAWVMLNNASSIGDKWGWIKGTAAVSLAAGTHTLEIANRESGLSLDKFAVLPTSATNPSGQGLEAVNRCN
jgi:V8-like Glu-specific endopeptidase